MRPAPDPRAPPAGRGRRDHALGGLAMAAIVRGRRGAVLGRQQAGRGADAAAAAGHDHDLVHGGLLRWNLKPPQA